MSKARERAGAGLRRGLMPRASQPLLAGKRLSALQEPPCLSKKDETKCAIPPPNGGRKHYWMRLNRWCFHHQAISLAVSCSPGPAARVICKRPPFLTSARLRPGVVAKQRGASRLFAFSALSSWHGAPARQTFRWRARNACLQSFAIAHFSPKTASHFSARMLRRSRRVFGPSPCLIAFDSSRIRAASRLPLASARSRILSAPAGILPCVSLTNTPFASSST